MRDQKLEIKNKRVLLCLVFFVFGFSTLGHAQDEIILRTSLFKGYHENFQPGPRPAISPADDRTNLAVSFNPENPNNNDIASIKELISSVYRVPYVALLTSADMIWDNKKETLNETAFYDLEAYPVQLSPISVEQNSLSLRIEAYKFDFERMSFLMDRARLSRSVRYQGFFDIFTDTPRIEDAIGGEKWLEKDLTLVFDSPVVLVLPTGDQSIFLSIEVSRRNESRMDVGLVGNRLFSYSIGGTDPVCGKKVGKGDGYSKDERPTASLNYHGETLLFCSEKCLAKFKDDPEKYFRNSSLKRRPIPTNLQDTSVSASARPILLTVPAHLGLGHPDLLAGSTKLELNVDDKGNVVGTHIIESTDAAFDYAVQESLGRWLFEPERLKGKPVASLYPINVVVRPYPGEQPAVREDANSISTISPAVLDRVVDYCARLEKTALYFTCREKITEIYEPETQVMDVTIEIRERVENGRPAGAFSYFRFASGEENSFTYDYQLIRKDSRIQERRVLINGNDQDVHDNKASPKTNRFYVNKSIFGPIGLMGQEASLLYDYRMLKEDTLGGRPTYVVDVRPKKATPGKAIYGKVWVDQKDASILKMDIEAESLTGYERVAADYESRGVKPLISIEVIYGYEKDGLRYPSEITLKERYSDPREGQIKMSRMSITYSQYKFFAVETEVKY